MDTLFFVCVLYDRPNGPNRSVYFDGLVIFLPGDKGSDRFYFECSAFVLFVNLFSFLSPDKPGPDLAEWDEEKRENNSFEMVPAASVVRVFA